MTTASIYASGYARMSGNCTLTLASIILSSLSPPITDASHILDNASGPGIVTSLIKGSCLSARITAADLDASMLSQARSLVSRNGWTDVTTAQLDVRDLSSLPDGSFSHVITNLGLPVPRDPDGGAQKALAEWYRVLHPGGVAVVSTWADRVWPAAFERVARKVKPCQEPVNRTKLESKFLSGAWLLGELERVFGRSVEVRCVETWTEAGSLAELAGNMMLAKNMFFASFGNEEMERASGELERELGALKSFWEWDGGVRVGMKAWVGKGWKLDGVVEEPCSM